jgi:endo-1,3(4)-beta-glucanase
VSRRAPVLGLIGLLVVVGVVVAVLLTRGGDGDTAEGGSQQTPQGEDVRGSVADSDVPGPPDAAVPDVDTEALVAGMHQAPVGEIDPIRLDEGLVPPTNRWFSGLVFTEEAVPAYPRPISVGFEAPGLTLSLPDPVTDTNAIVGPHVPKVTVDAGSDDILVTAHDDASVTVTLVDDAGEPLGRVVVAQGSPLLSLTADDAGELTLTTDVSFEAVDGVAPDGFTAATTEIEGRTWVAVAPEGAVDGTTVTLAAGETVTWYPLPDDPSDDVEQVLAQAATDPVTGTEATYGIGDGIARTTIGYRTADGGETAFVTMPHHRQGEQPERDRCDLGTYQSVYGTLELCAGSRLSSFAPALEPVHSLDLDGITDEQRELIAEQVRDDVEATPDFPSDTYFGGKWLYRAATLVTLGEQVGADDAVAPLREELVETLREWNQPDGCEERDHRCFAYDPDARGVVGLTPSFGSEEFNDHHFHYGYHLAAAGLMAADDPQLAEDLAPVMDVLAQDIAHVGHSEEFPRLRNFDVYAGHSWASGTVPFMDGNNQESSSEAVNAWNGLGLWAQARGQEEIVDLASWLMSTEAAAILYWTDLDLEDPVYDGYERTIVALNWGAKRDWATWFSAEPSAMLGILLIPMGPFAEYLAIEPDKIRASVEEASPDGYDVQFGDYLLMYLALAGPDAAQEAWDEIPDLPEDAVDDGNSRAYLMAWVAAQMAD